MKNILLVLFSTALLSSMACTNGKAGNDDKSNKKTETKQPAENKSGDEAVKAIHLTKAQFLEKVWDYEKNPDKWVYKGDKPCIIDFYADWCLPCHEWENQVWQNKNVQLEVLKNFVPVKIDCTTETDSCSQAINQYQVVGWPTILFLDRGLNELVEKRLVGTVMEADEFLEYVKFVEQ